MNTNYNCGHHHLRGKRALFPATFALAMIMAPLPALAQRTIPVDDDMRQILGTPFSWVHTTIQSAVSVAAAGDTILVFPGVYSGTVNIIGHDKDGLKIIAAGGPGEVVLQGDHVLRDGFHLEDVNGVLIQGFTIRDFGSVPTTATVWGVGNNIYLLRAHRNTIRHNRSTLSDMMGIMLMDSADNIIEDNLIWDIDPKGAGCGIHVQGSGSARNIIRRNHAYGNSYAGIMIRSAGIDNLLLENVVGRNGQFGITNWNTNGTRVEGNLSNLNPGRLMGPAQSPFGIGIDIRTSTGLTVKDNIALRNTGFDFYWDNSGSNTFADNPGLTSLTTVKISNSSNAARNPGFLVGDGFLVEIDKAPANSVVYLRLFKDGTDLGVTGPYGSITDSQGRWSFAGSYNASAVGSWLVQAVFGRPESSRQTGVISMTVK